MSHADALIEVLDPKGKPIGVKQRSNIDTTTDIYPCAYVLLFTTEGKVVLSEVPAGSLSSAPYKGLYSVTAATIQRKAETGSDAAKRALKNELGIPQADPEFKGEELAIFRDGRRNVVGVYTLTITRPPTRYNHRHVGKLVVVDRGTLSLYLKHRSEAVAPSLDYIWRKYFSN